MRMANVKRRAKISGINKKKREERKQKKNEKGKFTKGKKKFY